MITVAGDQLSGTIALDVGAGEELRGKSQASSTPHSMRPLYSFVERKERKIETLWSVLCVHYPP